MSVDDTRRDPAPSHDPDDSAHADSCLDCAIARVKRHLGVETEQAQIIASLLPEHLQRPFWERMVETYLDREVERLHRGRHDTFPIRHADGSTCSGEILRAGTIDQPDPGGEQKTAHPAASADIHTEETP